MAANPPAKLKWMDHHNSVWAHVDSLQLASREGVANLYDRLIDNKELITLPHQVLQLKGPPLPDYEDEVPSVDEQEHYINSLLASQLSLARAVCTDSPFAAILQKRLVVLQRVFSAIASKYHSNEKSKLVQRSPTFQNNSVTSSSSVDKAKTGSDVLIEMGVKTGLRLVFSLIRQNWVLSSQVGGGASLCNDVLQTALDVVSSLPPLSLVNESKLPVLGVQALEQVTQFLKDTALPKSGADCLGRRLASELVLTLSAQRGSLRYLLEWIDMALCASASFKANLEEESEQEQPGLISFDIFYEILRQMKSSHVSVLITYGIFSFSPLNSYISLMIPLQLLSYVKMVNNDEELC